MHRMPDGRFHVMTADGRVMGKHKSPWSAARQMHEYFGSTDQATGPTNIRPNVPRPRIPRPKQSNAPVERPKRIPRP